jgi:hypothetical protein
VGIAHLHFYWAVCFLGEQALVSDSHVLWEHLRASPQFLTSSHFLAGVREIDRTWES